MTTYKNAMLEPIDADVLDAIEQATIVKDKYGRAGLRLSSMLEPDLFIRTTKTLNARDGAYSKEAQAFLFYGARTDAEVTAIYRSIFADHERFMAAIGADILGKAASSAKPPRYRLARNYRERIAAMLANGSTSATGAQP